MAQDITLSVDGRPGTHQAGHEAEQEPRVHGADWASSSAVLRSKGRGRGNEDPRWTAAGPGSTPISSPTPRALCTGEGPGVLVGPLRWSQPRWGGGAQGAERGRDSPTPAGTQELCLQECLHALLPGRLLGISLYRREPHPAAKGPPPHPGPPPPLSLSLCLHLGFLPVSLPSSSLPCQGAPGGSWL